MIKIGMPNQENSLFQFLKSARNPTEEDINALSDHNIISMPEINPEVILNRLNNKILTGDILFRDFDGYWKEDFENPSLKDINLFMRKGVFYGIAGKVGSGKSGLLNAILGELPFYSGEFGVKGKCGICRTVTHHLHGYRSGKHSLRKTIRQRGLCSCRGAIVSHSGLCDSGKRGGDFGGRKRNDAFGRTKGTTRLSSRALR
jgi:hypothetical protein